MARHEEKPSTPGEALKHHGVKGMRWGHRKDDETGGDSSAKPDSAGPHPASGGRYLTIDEARAAGRKATSSELAKRTAASNASVKRMIAEAAKMDEKPSEANLLGAKQDWMNKFGSPDPKTGRVQPVAIPKERKKLTPTQKKLLKNAAIGAGVIGGVYLLNKSVMKAAGYDSTVVAALKGQMKGQPVSKDQFNTLVMHSQMKTWATNNYFKGDALTREGFELPAGHTFRRLSQAAESDFNILGIKDSVQPTYSVTNAEDWHRYLTNFRHEKGPGASFHEVTWNLTESVKVPSTKDVLSTMQDVLRNEGGRGTEREALNAYQAISGGGWRDTRSTNLVEALKKKGYGAVIDEMDAGVIGDKPLVFFAPESATGKTSKPLTEKTIAEAESLVKELQNRKN